LESSRRQVKERRSLSVNSFFFWGKGSNFQMEIIIWLQLIENCAKSQLLYKLLLLCAEEAEEEEEEEVVLEKL
jgi:hypothetical protein